MRRLTVQTVVKDYPTPDVDPDSVYTPDPSIVDVSTVETKRRYVITNIAETIVTTQYSTISYYVIRNTDKLNYVTHTYKSLAGAGTLTQRIYPGKELHLSDVDPATSPTLVAPAITSIFVDIIIAGNT